MMDLHCGGNVACLGPEGSHSALAASMFCPQGEILLCNTFPEAAERLKRGEADAAVFPIANSTQGGIRQNLDLLQRNSDFYAVAELVLPIDHRLAMLYGTSLADVDTIYSHEQAIAQCQNFLYQQFPRARYVTTDSTAQSLQMLDGHSAGIVGAHNRREGVVLSEENIADEPCNQTQFLLVRRGKENLPAHSKKIFVCINLAHRPGALLKFLQTIDSFGLNLTKIESRPVPSVPGEYRFFLEFEGDLSDKIVQYALPVLEKGCCGYRLLGAY